MTVLAFCALWLIVTGVLTLDWPAIMAGVGLLAAYWSIDNQG